MFGWQARIPLDVIFESTIPELRTPSQHIQLNMDKSLELAYELAKDHLGTAVERQKEHYDWRVHDKPTRLNLAAQSSYSKREFKEAIYIAHGLAPFELSNTCQTLSIESKIHRDGDGEQ